MSDIPCTPPACTPVEPVNIDVIVRTLPGGATSSSPTGVLLGLQRLANEYGLDEVRRALAVNADVLRRGQFNDLLEEQR